MTTVISVENLSKRYVITHRRAGSYSTVREAITSSIREGTKRLLRPILPESAKGGDNGQRENFYALRDVCFDIRQGDRIGIIGRNGAGKSTLLKVLSRITEPTTGRVKIRGRVASLLEVGTGFHPELTGRENIYLNGAILGMGKTEINRKFDEIVAFAEVERFLDTPVKRYSSGMYVRLAFAVAAHLEPEILIVDEVLAVGDAAFQRKCLEKMETVGHDGRTIVFVSHNMGAIQELTNRCLFLENGRVSYLGDVRSSVERYFESLSGSGASQVTGVESADDAFKVKKVFFDKERYTPSFDSTLFFGLELSLAHPFSNVSFGFGVVNSVGARILTMERTVNSLPEGNVSLRISLEKPALPPGEYYIDMGFGVGGSSLLYQEKAFSFLLDDTNVTSAYLSQKRDKIGVFRTPEIWVE